MTELHRSLERIPWSGSAPARIGEVNGVERPEAGCRQPDDVLNHPTMQADEKRALLASWVSDAHGIPDRPALRKLDNGAVVALDDILRALKCLDDDEEGATTPSRLTSVQFVGPTPPGRDGGTVRPDRPAPRTRRR